MINFITALFLGFKWKIMINYYNNPAKQSQNKIKFKIIN